MSRDIHLFYIAITKTTIPAHRQSLGAKQKVE